MISRILHRILRRTEAVHIASDTPNGDFLNFVEEQFAAAEAESRGRRPGRHRGRSRS